MELSPLSLIGEKVRTLCKECDLSSIPHKITTLDVNHDVVSTYLVALDELRSKIFIFRSQQQEYRKLQEQLQKHETKIRKHIGVEQQLKLYIDTIKIQYDESETERLELLDNSKRMIKQLKKENEKLFQQIQELSKDKTKAKLKKEHDHHDSITKTRLHTIGDIDNTSSNPKKKIGFPYKVQFSDRLMKKKDQKFFEMKKKQPNFNMMGYLSNYKKKVSKERERTPGKKRLTKDLERRINVTSTFKTLQKSNKKANKSVFSLSSIDFGKEEKPKEQKNQQNFDPFQQ